MAAPNSKSGVSKRKPKGEQATAESQLDDLFEVQGTRHLDESSGEAALFSRMDQLRRRFITDLIPAFDQIRQKYAEKGVMLELDADNFVNGGRKLTVTIEYEDAGTRLEGVVTSSAIAFTETRFSSSDRSGVAVSGPSLRIHDLNAHVFRDFVCRQIAPLVQAVLRRRR